ncbi:MAG: FRG domain-containing protein [Clostridiales bacterium]|nr:FRG domain-containing protein [Clostridiales bacterium]
MKKTFNPKHDASKYLEDSDYEINEFGKITYQTNRSKNIIKKITDITDAINIVAGNLDGQKYSFAPPTKILNDIFEGKNISHPHVICRYKFPFGIWFRGQSRICYNLEPSLYRESIKNDIVCPKHKHQYRSREVHSYYEETSMFNHFVTRMPNYQENYTTSFDWLCLMQHYELPTRLLDWTESILIALYFAVREYDNCDGVLYALNPGRLNEIARFSKSKRHICIPTSADVILRSNMAISRTIDQLRSNLMREGTYEVVLAEIQDEDIKLWLQYGKSAKNIDFNKVKLKFSLPIGVFPNRINDRMSMQLSVVTLFGGKSYDPKIKTNFDSNECFLEFKSLTEFNEEVSKINKKSKFLSCFVVDKTAKRLLREQLKRIGIHDASLFPELEYQAKFIKKHWRIPRDGGFVEYS